MTLPSLADFYMVGNWATSAAALSMNASFDRKAIQAICEKDRKKFISSEKEFRRAA